MSHKPISTLSVSASTLATAILILGCGTATGSNAAPPRLESAPKEEAAGVLPLPPRATGNPLLGATLWTNPRSQAAAAAGRLATTAPGDAELIRALAAKPQGQWLGEWSGNVRAAVAGIMGEAHDQVPLFVIYDLPYRDCGGYSKGGHNDPASYRQWIREVARGLGTGRAALVLEPDALGLLDKCLTAAQQAERLELMREAVLVLRQNPNAAVYLDAGHARWVPAPVMAERLLEAGLEHAHGFALNTSNYVTTEENTAYGEKISELAGGAHFVIDTSRNGNGSAPGDEWCNPHGRRLGAAPRVAPGHPLVDAWFWTKPPGESDGECNGGPKAGAFWVEMALELSRS